jgi:hypothetical protein
MAARIAVEALDRAAELERSNYTLLREIIQVSIDGTEAYARNPAANSRVELVRARMAVKPPQLLKNDGSLSRISHDHHKFER